MYSYFTAWFIKACPLLKSDLSSFDFAVNRLSPQNGSQIHMPFSCLYRVRCADAAPVMFEECYAAAAGDSDADPVAATDVDSAWSHADTLLLIETYRQFRGQRDGCVQQTVRTP